VIGVLVGALITVLETLVPRLWPWVRSAMGLGFGWIGFLSNALALTIGAIFVWVWNKAPPKYQDAYSLPIASGLIAGDSLM